MPPARGPRGAAAARAVSAVGPFSVDLDGSRTVVLTPSGATLRRLGAPGPEVLLCCDQPILAAIAIAGETWLATSAVDGVVVRRFDVRGDAVGVPLSLALPGALAISAARNTAAVLIESADAAAELRFEAGEVVVLPVAGVSTGDRRILVGPGARVERRFRKVVLTRCGGERPTAVPRELLDDAVIAGGCAVRDGIAVAVELRAPGRHHLVVIDARTGAMVLRMRLEGTAAIAYAERRGAAVLAQGGRLVVIDLRHGERIAEHEVGGTIVSVAVDGDARVALCEVRQPDGEHAVLTRVLAGPVTCPAMVLVDDDSADAEKPPDPEPACPPVSGPASDDADDEAAAADDATADAADPAADTDDAATITAAEPVPEVAALSALGAPASRALSAPALRRYLDDAFAVVAGFCRTAAAVGGDAGRVARTGPLPLADELDALLERRSGREEARLVAARTQERAATARFARWNRPGAPHADLTRDLGLSPTAATILMIAAAPLVWGELARAYALVANDRGRPLVDELLIAQLVEADAATRAAIAAELDEGAPLRRWGAIEIGAGARPFAAIEVHPAVVRRLASSGGGPIPGASVRIRDADRSLAEIRAPRGSVAALLAAIAEHRGEVPPRIVLRGRLGSGRRTLAAALAAGAGRALGLVEPAPPMPGQAPEEPLRRMLVGVALRGLLPCITIDATVADPVMRERLRAVLDVHPGPMVLRCGPDAEPPLAPGYHELELPSLSEGERIEVWREALAARGLSGVAAESVAGRFSVGPGIVVRAANQVAAAGTPATSTSCEAALVAALRQHRANRLGGVATRVERLGDWSDLILADDLLDSLRELVARVRCRHTVLERWGMGRIAASARGVTALLQGAPGTGKTMAAGVLARELGFELWRVDLSRVTSKWLGETEKNLATVFDAAEDGEVILLFDEADSLFGKRTAVRTSQDRHANAEVNYLLQRLDSFTGLAVLTTNFGTSIDAAFQRRLSLHLQFPFPDEAERERLWRAHLPPTLPVARGLGLAALARKYQLSGGYIRNAALRAAYLAAAEGTPLSADHLLRAVTAEYRDKGKVCEGGVLE